MSKPSKHKLRVIYLASPYSYTSKIPGVSWIVRKYRERLITQIAGRLHDSNPDVAFILPITQSHRVARYMKTNSTAFSAWADRDLEFIRRSDEVWVVLMSGWDRSIGVKAEIKFALGHDIPVKYLNSSTLNQEVKPSVKSNKKTNSKILRSRKSKLPSAKIHRYGNILDILPSNCFCPFDSKCKFR